MLIAKFDDLKENFNPLCDKVFGGETLLISGPENKNIVMISEKEYNKIIYNSMLTHRNLWANIIVRKQRCFLTAQDM